MLYEVITLIHDILTVHRCLLGHPCTDQKKYQVCGNKNTAHVQGTPEYLVS